MRDIIWTLIVIWLIYKLVDIFKGSSKRSFVNNSSSQDNTTQDQQSSRKANFAVKKDPKDVIQKSADKEGDYIDFEEIK